MKIIQERELERIISMLGSGDPEMKKLGAKLLKKKERIRLSLMTIIGFHFLFLMSVSTLFIYISYQFKLGWYLVPFILSLIFQVVWSVYHVMTIADHREVYNKFIAKQLDS